MKSLKITFFTICLLAVTIVSAQKSAPTLKKQLPTVAGTTDPSNNCQLRYYYYPNLEAYFDTKKNIYYYMQNGKWITAEEIPNGYKGYSLYKMCKTAVNDYDDEDPTQFINLHKKQFPYAANGKIKNTMMAVSD